MRCQGKFSTDAGYNSAQAVADLHGLRVDPFVAPEQTRHGRAVPPAPRGRIPVICPPRQVRQSSDGLLDASFQVFAASHHDRTARS